MGFIYKLRRAETPFYRGLKRVLVGVGRSTLPYPRFIKPAFRALFLGHRFAAGLLRKLNSYLFREPMFRSRCESVGKGFNMNHLPFVVGHAKIYIGEHVNFFGNVSIMTGSILAEPKLIIGNRVDVGHNVGFVVNEEIAIDDDVNIGGGAQFRDSDGHPRDMQARIADLPPPREEIKPIHICRGAWIGQNAFVMKGVTIGEGAIIGANSVVLTDVPPFSVAIGNPARVVVKNINAQVAAPS
jgi:acetyltransferase-like isoleucine patch superfamily enzyme